MFAVTVYKGKIYSNYMDNNYNANGCFKGVMVFDG